MIPFECLANVERDLKSQKLKNNGIYLAHDSMGHARYAGRGAIFTRLKARKKAHPHELQYFPEFDTSNLRSHNTLGCNV